MFPKQVDQILLFVLNDFAIFSPFCEVIYFSILFTSRTTTLRVPINPQAHSLQEHHEEPKVFKISRNSNASSKNNPTTFHTQTETNEGFQEPGPFHEIPGTGVWLYSVFYELPRSSRYKPGLRAIGVAPDSARRLYISCHVTFHDGHVRVSRRKLDFAEDSHKQK